MRTLTRNTIAALLLAPVLLVALPRHASLAADLVDVFALGFCFTLLGHYVDALLLALQGIETAVGRLVRLAGWFAGGLWCYVVARWLWIKLGRDLSDLPGLLWRGILDRARAGHEQRHTAARRHISRVSRLIGQRAVM